MKNLLITIILFSSSAFAQKQSIIDRSSKTRIRVFKNNGGQISTLKAIEKSLDWFKKNQNPDGSWGKSAQDTLTAFVIKAFLANGILPSSPKMGQTLNKALDFLSKQEISARNGRGYGHAIQTIAIAEAYGMTGDPELKKLLDASIKIIVDGQQNNGAFDYFLKKESDRQDLSISSWIFQALKTAKEAGCTEQGLNKAITQGIIYLVSHTSKNNEFCYSTRGNEPKTTKARHTMRAAGSLSLLNFYSRIHKELKNDLKDISTEDLKNINWKNPPKECLYGWFYATQAMFHSGSSKWGSWYKTLQKEMVTYQKDDGSWEYPGNFYGTSMKDHVALQAYATSLCVLTLSTPYRFPKDRTEAMFNVPISKK